MIRYSLFSTGEGIEIFSKWTEMKERGEKKETIEKTLKRFNQTSRLAEKYFFSVGESFRYCWLFPVRLLDTLGSVDRHQSEV